MYNVQLTMDSTTEDTLLSPSSRSSAAKCSRDIDNSTAKEPNIGGRRRLRRQSVCSKQPITDHGWPLSFDVPI